MVDMGFLKRGEFQGKKKVEFFDVDMPTTGDVEDVQVTTTDLVRKQIEAGKENFDKMEKEADELAVKNPATFDRAVEMIGQIKNIKKAMEDAVNEIIKPIYQEYKAGRNILTSFTPKLDAIRKTVEKKQNDYAYQAELKRRDEAAKAAKAAAALQAEIDRKQAEQAAAEAKAAKIERREPIELKPIVVDTPEIPREIKTVTESGSAKIEMVLVPTVTNLKSEYVIDKVLYYFEDKFLDLATKAADKAIKAGAIGLAGAPGITVEEKAVTKHRRR